MLHWLQSLGSGMIWCMLQDSSSALLWGRVQALSDEFLLGNSRILVAACHCAGLKTRGGKTDAHVSVKSVVERMLAAESEQSTSGSDSLPPLEPSPSPSARMAGATRNTQSKLHRRWERYKQGPLVGFCWSPVSSCSDTADSGAS